MTRSLSGASSLAEVVYLLPYGASCDVCRETRRIDRAKLRNQLEPDALVQDIRKRLLGLKAMGPKGPFAIPTSSILERGHAATCDSMLPSGRPIAAELRDLPDGVRGRDLLDARLGRNDDSAHHIAGKLGVARARHAWRWRHSELERHAVEVACPVSDTMPDKACFCDRQLQGDVPCSDESLRTKRQVKSNGAMALRVDVDGDDFI